MIAGSEVGFRVNQGIPDDQGPEYVSFAIL